MKIIRIIIYVFTFNILLFQLLLVHAKSNSHVESFKEDLYIPECHVTDVRKIEKNRFVVSCSGIPQIAIFDLAFNSVVSRKYLDFHPTQIYLNDNSLFIFGQHLNDKFGRLIRLDLQSLEILSDTTIVSPNFSPTKVIIRKNAIFVNNISDEVLRIFDVRTLSLVEKIRITDGPIVDFEIILNTLIILDPISKKIHLLTIEDISFIDLVFDFDRAIRTTLEISFQPLSVSAIDTRGIISSEEGEIFEFSVNRREERTKQAIALSDANSKGRERSEIRKKAFIELDDQKLLARPKLVWRSDYFRFNWSVSRLYESRVLVWFARAEILISVDKDGKPRLIELPVGTTRVRIHDFTSFFALVPKHNSISFYKLRERTE